MKPRQTLNPQLPTVSCLNPGQKRGLPIPGRDMSHPDRVIPFATLSAARFSRYRDPQDYLEDQQRTSLKSWGSSLSRFGRRRVWTWKKSISKTFIQVYNLKAIEEGNLRCLPEPFYIRAFIRKYANALGLDGNQLMAEFP